MYPTCTQLRAPRQSIRAVTRATLRRLRHGSGSIMSLARTTPMYQRVLLCTMVCFDPRCWQTTTDAKHLACNANSLVWVLCSWRWPTPFNVCRCRISLTVSISQSSSPSLLYTLPLLVYPPPCSLCHVGVRVEYVCIHLCITFSSSFHTHTHTRARAHTHAYTSFFSLVHTHAHAQAHFLSVCVSLPPGLIGWLNVKTSSWISNGRGTLPVWRVQQKTCLPCSCRSDAHTACIGKCSLLKSLACSGQW